MAHIAFLACLRTKDPYDPAILVLVVSQEADGMYDVLELETRVRRLVHPEDLQAHP